VRFGDPETQPIMMRLKSDLVEHCLQAMDKKLDSAKLEWDERTALGVVLAAGGYPDSYKKGDVISGLENTETSSSKHISRRNHSVWRVKYALLVAGFYAR